LNCPCNGNFLATIFNRPLRKKKPVAVVLMLYSGQSEDNCNVLEGQSEEVT